MKGEEEKSTKFSASREVWTLKFNSQMIEKMHTHDLYLLPKCHTKLEGKLNLISLEFEIEFVEPNFGAKISLIMISEF